MKNKHQQQSEKTYQAFIDAIMKIIAEGDIEKFTIRSLCSSLGLSPRTFYLYFKNKDHAILQCYNTHEEELLKQILEAQKEAADPLDKVLQIFDAKVVVSLKFAKLGRELYVCALHYYDENLFDDTIPLYVKVKEALDECLEKKLYSFNEDTRTVAWELIDFSRGIVFDYYLRQEGYDLRSVSAKRMKRYLGTFVQE